MIYYEHVMQELNKMVDEIDGLSSQKEKLDGETRPDQVLFRKRSKVLKVKMNNSTGKVVDHSNNLFQAINEKNKILDWERLLDMKLKQSKLEREQEKVTEKFRGLRKKHYGKMAPFMKKKRAISKSKVEITGKIFERIRRK